MIFVHIPSVFVVILSVFVDNPSVKSIGFDAESVCPFVRPSVPPSVPYAIAEIAKNEQIVGAASQFIINRSSTKCIICLLSKKHPLNVLKKSMKYELRPGKTGFFVSIFDQCPMKT